jgi:DNA-binding LytR/AlgR family response regulator
MKPHVLILEDDFLLAAHMEEVVQDDLKGDPIGVSSVAEALEIIPDEIALAFLDIEVRDGKSYAVARKLMQNDIPCIIVSGNEPSTLPSDLKRVPLLSKPIASGRLVRLAKTLCSEFS